jgi:hypothetical protein
MKRTREEVAREIEKFLNGDGGAYDWDDFVSIPIRDERLNAIRIECAEPRDMNPPDNCRQYCGEQGLKRPREILRDLEAK